MATRGRPRKADPIPGPDDDESGIAVTDDGTPVNPVVAFATPDDTGNSGGGNDDGTASPKRRGRKPGTGKKTSSLDLSGIEAMLYSIHIMGASVMKTPELMLSKDEAGNLAKALDGVQQHYPFVADPKALAWVNLAMVAGAVYVPRIILASKRKATQRQAVPPAPVKTAPIEFNNGPVARSATGGEPPVDTTH